LTIQIPADFEFLFQPARYKVLYGGRGSGKSLNVARTLLVQGAAQQLRILCARELQNSIRDSVHRLLADEIELLGLQDFYEVQNSVIRGMNGTEFIFKGLRHNISEIKSLQGVDRCWVEEAQTVSNASWDVLIPTIRKNGSEIWITFNPELDTDATYTRFVKHQPPDAFVKKVNWDRNPFFPDVLRKEMEHLKQTDPDAWLTVWEGNCRHTLDGAIYAKEIREATEQGRITKVPYDRTKPVSTFWDLGWSDMTSIWFAQIVGFEFRIIDFVQDRQKTVADFLEILQAKGYVYDTDWLPHDGDSEQLAAGGRSIKSQMMAAGRKVRIVPNIKVVDGINALRTVFPNCWFDEDRTADGLQALRRYCYDVDAETGQYSRRPRHDEYSHAADALRMMAVALKEPRKETVVKPFIAAKRPLTMGQGGWMRR